MVYTYNFKKDLDSGSYTYSNHCVHCGQSNMITIDEYDYFRWKIQSTYAQTVFPWLSPDQREVLISGTHPNCWNEAFVEIE
jgi:hypothetical protein